METGTRDGKGKDFVMVPVREPGAGLRANSVVPEKWTGAGLRAATN
jgi:hypothetical protein